MKDFMVIFIGQSYTDLGLSPEEMQTQMGKWWAWQSKLEASGNLKSGHALTADIKRISGPNRTVTDGPFAESKEVVGGYYVFAAKDFDEAMLVAQDYPDYDFGGTVEVREVMVFEQ